MKKKFVDNKKNMLKLLDVEIQVCRGTLQSLLILKWTIENRLRNK